MDENSRMKNRKLVFWGRCGLGISLKKLLIVNSFFFYFYLKKSRHLFVLMLYYSLPHDYMSHCFYFCYEFKCNSKWIFNKQMGMSVSDVMMWSCSFVIRFSFLYFLICISLFHLVYFFFNDRLFQRYQSLFKTKEEEDFIIEYF